MLLGSQGEWSDSVWAGQCKCNPQLFKEKKKNLTQSLGPTVGRSIASFLCTQDLTLFREAWQREESWPPRATSCHGLLRCSSWQVLLWRSFYRQSQGAAWSGQEQKALFTEVRGNKEHVYTWEHVILSRPSVPPAVLALEDARYGPYPWTGRLPLPREMGPNTQARSLPLWTLLPSVMG